MIILALEFSSPHRSAALVRQDGGGQSIEILGTASDEGVKAVKPLQLIERLLRDTGVPRKAIEALAIGLGPGSYTGIRSAIALAQGWQLAAGIHLTGIS